MLTNIKNWAGNYEYSTTNLHYPETVEQVKSLVVQCKQLRVLGTRHSFNGIADSTENLISLERYAPSISIDKSHRTVSIATSVNYGQLCPLLHDAGFALHNLGSLPHISVVGACTTATHGSGDRNRNLAAALSGMELVTANGDLVHLSREYDGDLFDGAIINLGGLGVIVKLTLDLLPTFEMRQVVYENLPFSILEAHFDEIMSSAYSVSLFTDWQQEYINQVWLKHQHSDNLETSQPEFFGATLAKQKLHPIARLAAERCTEQLGLRGAWYERLPHFRFEATPSAGNELQSEYFVPREHALAALHAVASLRHELAPHLLISEIRSIAADNFWMSPCYHRDSIAFHFTWRPDWSSVEKLLPLLEAQLSPFNARPHWGKLFAMPPLHLRSLYEKLPQFRELLLHYDPNGKFRNMYMDRLFFEN